MAEKSQVLCRNRAHHNVTRVQRKSPARDRDLAGIAAVRLRGNDEAVGDHVQVVDSVSHAAFVKGLPRIADDVAFVVSTVPWPSVPAPRCS